MNETSDDARVYPSLRELYLSFDRRTLALTRVALGFFLLFDLFRRTPDWLWMYSNEGVLPVHHNLWRPQSAGWTLFNAFNTPGEVWALWLLGFFIFSMLLLGYQTRLFQVLAAVYVASANGRVLLIENGGYVVQNLLLLWTAFLPLGERFSIDAWLRERRQRQRQPEHTQAQLNRWESRVSALLRTPHVSLVGAAIALQLSALYFFNVVHKTGPAWANNTAVHYVLYNDRMATPLVAAIRDHLPNVVVLFLSKLVMILEAGLPLVLLSPLARVWSRRFVIVGIFMLHIGFGSSFVLGPFAWSLCVFATLFVSREDWEVLFRVMRRSERAVVIRYNPTSRAALWFCRAAKRADGLRLVTFEEDRDVAHFVVVHAGSCHTGAQALLKTCAALPLGPLVAAIVGLRPVTLLLDALITQLSKPVMRLLGWNAPVVYPTSIAMPEKDDAAPVAFVPRWLDQRHSVRGLQLSFVGAFVAVYGGPLLHRAKSGLHKTEIAGALLGDVAFGVGIVMAAAGLLLVAWTMLQTVADMADDGHARVLRVRHVFRETLVVVMFAGAVNQALVELWVAKPLRFPQPPVMRALSHKLRYLQGWFMFSPNPVMDDGIIVVDAITVDGRHVDPFSIHYGDKRLRAPNFDLLHAKSLTYNQIWSDYFNRMHLQQNSSHRKPMKEFIYRLPQRTGDRNDAIVSGDVYWVHDLNPKWNSIESYKESRDKLFSFRNDKAGQSPQARNQGTP